MAAVTSAFCGGACGEAHLRGKRSNPKLKEEEAGKEGGQAGAE
mgnify:CR=1 FL=1